MNIYLDFDDTITMSVENVLRIINRRYGTNVSVQDIGKWDFSDVYPNIPLKDIINVFGEEEFFNTLKIKPNAIMVLSKFARYNEIIIVSKVDHNAMINKHKWIQDHLVNIGINVKFVGVPLQSSKNIVDMSGGIMVDDNVKFLNETNAKYKIFFCNNRKFDKSQEWDGLIVHNWLELKNMLTTIIAKEKGYREHGKI